MEEFHIDLNSFKKVIYMCRIYFHCRQEKKNTASTVVQICCFNDSLKN